MIASSQIRAARALIRWTADDLARASKIGIATIRRFELQEGVPSGQVRILDALKSTLEDAGVEFLATPEDEPGVPLKSKK